jgi:hypothetical protein
MDRGSVDLKRAREMRGVGGAMSVPVPVDSVDLKRIVRSMAAALAQIHSK